MQSPGGNGSRSTPGALSLTGLRREACTRHLAGGRWATTPPMNGKPARIQGSPLGQFVKTAARRERIFSARPELEGAIANGSRECAPDDRLRVLRPDARMAEYAFAIPSALEFCERHKTTNSG